jgi:hypothetical protein
LLSFSSFSYSFYFFLLFLFFSIFFIFSDLNYTNKVKNVKNARRMRTLEFIPNYIPNLSQVYPKFIPSRLIASPCQPAGTCPPASMCPLSQQASKLAGRRVTWGTRGSFGRGELLMSTCGGCSLSHTRVFLFYFLKMLHHARRLAC